jgi:hypothetical protein
MSTSPHTLAAERRAQTMAERINSRLEEAQLAALDQPPPGVAAVAPWADTAEARVVLAEYVLGILHRAGLAEAFRALLVNDAMESGHERLMQLVGAVRVEVERVGNPPTHEWHLPKGMPRVTPAEPVARELAARMVAKETARAESQAERGTGGRHA